MLFQSFWLLPANAFLQGKDRTSAIASGQGESASRPTGRSGGGLSRSEAWRSEKKASQNRLPKVGRCREGCTPRQPAFRKGGASLHDQSFFIGPEEKLDPVILWL
jgi:hypothetical protein